MVCGRFSTRPNAVSIREDELPVAGAGIDLIKIGEIADEDALELASVGAAVRLAWLVQDAAGVSEDGAGDGGGSDFVGCGEQRAVVTCLIEFGQAAEDDALIVGPGGLAVVAAVCVEAIVDEMV